MADTRRQRIEQLYLDTLDVSVEERGAFLAQQCQGDAALQREVESLLELHAAADDFLEEPAIASAARTLAEVVPAPKPPEITGYRIIRELGEGGMGLVYLAEQEAPLGRLVALKLIRPGMDSRQVIARFNAERQALARMDHRNIATVYDAGTTADGRPYFVMEFVDGVPITEYCDRHRLPTRERLALFIDVCSAVQHAHQKGVIHRDLKPSNVLVTEQDGRAMPKVIDFGTAKAVERPWADAVTLTAQGIVLGTIEYMSPEQAAFSRDIDTTTDVYSMGVVLYELLTGVLPFERPRPGPGGYDELRRLIRESDPPKPSTRMSRVGAAPAEIAAARQTDPDRLSRALRGDLDWITLKALEKDRKRRYPAVSGLAVDIRRFLSDQPVEARPPSAAYRARKFTRRHRGGVLAAATLLIVLLAGLATSTTLYFRARDARVEAEYRTYVATIAAADGELRANFPKLARDRLLAVPAAQRGWEWEHLFLKTDTSLATLVSSNRCESAGRSPSSKNDKAIVLTDQESRIVLSHCQTLERWDLAATTHAADRVDGDILAVGPAGELLIAKPGPGPGAWQLQRVKPGSGELLGSVGPLQAEPVCAALSPDGMRVAVGLKPVELKPAPGRPRMLEDTFEIWDARTSRRLARMVPPRPPLFEMRNLNLRRGPICMIAFSPDSTRVASSAATVSVWRADSGIILASDPTQAGTISQPIAFNADGTRLAIGRRTGLVDILNVDAARRLDRLAGGEFIHVPPLSDDYMERQALVVARKRSEVLSIAFSPDGRHIVTGNDTSVGLWDVAEGVLAALLAGHDAEVGAVTVGADGRIVSADLRGVVKIWSGAQPVAARVVPASSSERFEFVLSGNGAAAAVAQLDGGLFAWRFADSSRMLLKPANRSPLPHALAISDDGRQVLVAENGAVRAYLVATGESTTIRPNRNLAAGCEDADRHIDYVVTMAVARDGRSFAFDRGNCLVVQDLETMENLAVLRGSPSAVVFKPDGSLVVVSAPKYFFAGEKPSATDPRTIRIWDPRTRAVRVEVPAPVASNWWTLSWRLAISRDGSRLAVFAGKEGQDTVVSIWDGDLRHEFGRLPVPPETTHVAFSVDGRRMATVGWDMTVRIWDTERRQLLLVLTDDDAHANGGVAFTPDGRLVAGRTSGGLTVWETRRPDCDFCPKKR